MNNQAENESKKYLLAHPNCISVPVLPVGKGYRLGHVDTTKRAGNSAREACEG